MYDQATTNTILATLANLLANWGLGGLYRVLPDGSPDPSSWLMRMYGQGIQSADSLAVALRETPEFQQRFKVIFAIEDARRGVGPYARYAGMVDHVPTAAEVVAWEQSAREVMRRAGVPPRFLEGDGSDLGLTEYMARGFSVAELSTRLIEVHNRVAMAPPEVRNRFTSWFGADGDGALAAYFLDPSRSEQSLLHEVQTAEVGGMASIGGMGISETTAATMAQAGVSGQDALQTAAALGTADTLLQGSVAGDTSTISDDQAMLGASGLDEGAADRLRRRQEERRAEGGGGARTSGTITAFGTSSTS